MFVLQARFAYEDPIVGAWDDEVRAIECASALSRQSLEERLEAAECLEPVCNLNHLLLNEVGGDGVEREVMRIEGEDWCDKNGVD